MDFLTVKSIEAEFPDWEVFQGVDRRWHARLRGADTPVMVHDDDLVGLREEIQRKISKLEEAAYRPPMTAPGPSSTSGSPECSRVDV